jgi:hypothetical protein
MKIAAYKKRVPLDKLNETQRKRYLRHLAAIRREGRAREESARRFHEKRKLFLQQQYKERLRCL